MFRHRGSKKIAPGIRVNYGKSGLTSVNIAGINVGSGHSSGGRGPTKAQIVAKHWRPRPGTYFVTIDFGDDLSVNMAVDGGQFTYDRMMRINKGLYDRNSDAVARTFKSFVIGWDVVDDKGKPLQITKTTVDQLGVDMIFGLAIEIADALEISKDRLGPVFTVKDTGKPPRTAVSQQPPPSTNWPKQPKASPEKKSGGCCLWPFMVGALTLAWGVYLAKRAIT